MQRFFFSCKKKKNSKKKKKEIFDIFYIFAQNIDCGYTLELPHRDRGGSNEYPQSIFWRKNKRNRYTPVLLYQSGVEGYVHCRDMSA